MDIGNTKPAQHSRKPSERVWMRSGRPQVTGANTNSDANAINRKFSSAERKLDHEEDWKTTQASNQTSQHPSSSRKPNSHISGRRDYNRTNKRLVNTPIQDDNSEQRVDQDLLSRASDNMAESRINSSTSKMNDHQEQIKQNTVEELALSYSNSEHAVDGNTLKCLREIVHSEEQLNKAGYVTRKLTTAQLQGKKRCENCNKMIGAKPSLIYSKETAKIFDTIALKNRYSAPSSVEDTEFPKIYELRCKFHPGKVINKIWTCCQTPLNGSNKFCKGRIGHEPRYYGRGLLESLWQYHFTPSISQDARAAVAIDCEMGLSVYGDSELIRVSLVDFFTSEVLVDKLVYPEVRVNNFNTKYSGVTRQQMEDARKHRTCFFGKKQALHALWNYVDERTVIVGHSAQNDLNSLRWIHGLIVDSLLIEQAILRKEKEEQEKRELEAKKFMEEAMANGSLIETEDNIINEEETVENEKKDEKKPPKRKGSGPLSLKTLTKRRVGRDIQLGNNGHDSVEDALAARDVVRWHVIARMNGKVAEAVEFPTQQLIDLSLERSG